MYGITDTNPSTEYTCTSGPFYLHGLILIPAWKIIHIHYNCEMELLTYS